MGLFGRTEQHPTPDPARASETATPVPRPRPAPASEEVTLVARSAKVEGQLTGAGDLRIEGTVEGEVRIGGRLVVGEGGRVKARLHGKTVSVAGSVEGDVSADERIELTPTARLTGNITAPRILIQEGATFEGQVFMRSPAKEDGTRPAGEPPAASTSARRPSREGKQGGRSRS